MGTTKMASEDKWTQKGITFKVATMHDYKKLRTFLATYFFPEEPIGGTLKLYEGDGWGDKILKKLLDEEFINKGMKDETTLLALDQNGDIVGSRVGCIFDKNSATDEAKLLGHYMRFCSLFSWLLPQKFKTVNDATLFMEHAKYGKGMAFEDVPNATKFYNGLSLTVGSKARGLGLGKELIERTNAIAKEKGCSHVYIAATSKYSQAIFKKMNFEVLHETDYSGFKGRNGEDLFKDLKDHKSCQIVLFDLSNLSSSG